MYFLHLEGIKIFKNALWCDSVIYFLIDVYMCYLLARFGGKVKCQKSLSFALEGWVAEQLWETCAGVGKTCVDCAVCDFSSILIENTLPRMLCNERWFEKANRKKMFYRSTSLLKYLVNSTALCAPYLILSKPIPVTWRAVKSLFSAKLCWSKRCTGMLGIGDPIAVKTDLNYGKLRQNYERKGDQKTFDSMEKTRSSHY